MVPASLVAERWASVKSSWSQSWDQEGKHDVLHAGTVITACVTGCPKYASAVSFIFIKTVALISSGV